MRSQSLILQGFQRIAQTFFVFVLVLFHDLGQPSIIERESPSKQKQKPKATMKTYIEIEFKDHSYTATITEFGQLSKFLSSKDETFKIKNIMGATPKWLVTELNMVSRFSKSRNTTANI